MIHFCVLLQNQMITALTALAEKIENLQADVDEIKLKVDHMMPSYWRKNMPIIILCYIMLVILSQVYNNSYF